MKEIEEERERQRENEKQQRENEERQREYEEQQRNKSINKKQNDILKACKIFNIKFSELNPTNLKKSYRKLILKYHPDKPGGDTEFSKQLTSSNLLLKEYLNI